jgi:DNA replicative helicase MCM subunit Mcm2 (Cdc46/Mcm family)
MASFEVSYQSLSSHVPILAIWVADAPRDVIEIFDEVANELVLSSDYFPDYSKIRREIHIRIRDLPIIDMLRDLRQNHLNQLVRVSGVVTRRSIVFPQLKMVHFRCLCCDVSLGPFRQNNTTEVLTACECCVTIIKLSGPPGLVSMLSETWTFQGRSGIDFVRQLSKTRYPRDSRLGAAWARPTPQGHCAACRLD